MTDPPTWCSRRRALLGATTLLAGCSAVPSPRGQTTATPPPLETSEQVVSSAPTCSDSDADQLVTVHARGFTIVTASRDRAAAVRETLTTASNAEYRIEEDGLRLVDYPDSDRVAVEVEAGETEIGELSRFRGDSGILAVREGRAGPTIQEVGASVLEQIEATETIRPTRVSVRYVRPEPPKSLSFVVLLWGVGETAVLEQLTSFELRVATGDGERTVLTGTDIAGASVPSGRETPVLSITVAESARGRVRDAVLQAATSERAPAEPLRVYSDGELLQRLSVSKSLREEMRRGVWSESGSFTVRVASESTATRIAAALGLLSFSVPTEATTAVCGA